MDVEMEEAQTIGSVEDHGNKIVQFNWADSIILADKVESYVGTYLLGPFQDKKKCLIFVVPMTKNRKNNCVEGDVRATQRSDIYKDLARRPRFLQLLGMYRLTEKPMGFPNRNERWCLVFEGAETSLLYFFQALTNQKSDNAQRFNSLQDKLPYFENLNTPKALMTYIIPIMRDCLYALLDLHSAGYVLGDVTPNNFLVRERRMTSDAKIFPFFIYICDASLSIKKVEQIGDRERKKVFVADFCKMSEMLIFFMTGKWKNNQDQEYELESAEAYSLWIMLKTTEFASIQSVLKHPFFWNSNQVVEFYADACDFLLYKFQESNDIKKEQLKRGLKQLGKDVFGNDWCSDWDVFDWKATVDPNNKLINLLNNYRIRQQYPTIQTTSIMDLIKVFRNLKSHKQPEVIEAIPELVNNEGISKYIKDHVPKLTMNLYWFLFNAYYKDEGIKKWFYA